MTICFTVRPWRCTTAITSSMSSPGSMTRASFVCSSPVTEQLHCSGPTGKISWIIISTYHESPGLLNAKLLGMDDMPLESLRLSEVNCAPGVGSELLVPGRVGLQRVCENVAPEFLVVKEAQPCNK